MVDVTRLTFSPMYGKYIAIDQQSLRGLPLIMYSPRGIGGGGGKYISIAYHMQTGGGSR